MFMRVYYYSHFIDSNLTITLYLLVKFIFFPLWQALYTLHRVILKHPHQWSYILFNLNSTCIIICHKHYMQHHENEQANETKFFFFFFGVRIIRLIIIKMISNSSYCNVWLIWLKFIDWFFETTKMLYG